MFGTILAENQCFSQHKYMFPAPAVFFGAGTIFCQKMNFSGACGYVSGHGPLLLCSPLPFFVARLPRNARLPGMCPVTLKDPGCPGYPKLPGCPVTSARLLPGYYRLASMVRGSGVGKSRAVPLET